MPSPSAPLFACAQFCSGTDPGRNLDEALAMVAKAAANKVDLLSFPECCNLLNQDKEQLRRSASLEEEDRFLRTMQEQAKKRRMWIHLGSLVLRHRQDSEDLLNRGFLIDTKGVIQARYTKIHLFDANPGDGSVYRESSLFSAGDKAVVAETPWGGFGMSICYDLRFPLLYETLVQKGGARILGVPAAFTRPTGQADWHVLLRARAIEQRCFVVAAAQSGRHEDGRATFGHSLILSPSGKILAERKETLPGLLTAVCDFSVLEEARRRLPSHRHRRDFQLG